MKTTVSRNCSINFGSLVLVNSANPYTKTLLTHNLVPLNDEYSGILLERRAVVLLDRLMCDIRGWRQISPVSGWRTREEQEELWNQSLKESGIKFTKKYVAAPGCSEHQTGLAVDLGLKQESIDFIRPDFPYSGICQIFREKAPLYGFVERYPDGKKQITGIDHEPWHFRYVGTPHSEIMTKMGLTLEEYHQFLKQYHYRENPFVLDESGRRIEVSFIPAGTDSDMLFEVERDVPSTISGNNTDGFIVTVWREKN